MIAGKPILAKVTIDGIDASAFLIEYDLNPQLGNIVKSMTIQLNNGVYTSIPNLQTAPNNLTVVVQRGVTLATEQTIFQGKVVERQTTGNRIVVKCNDNLFEAVKKNITKTFDKNVDTEAGKISEIFKTLVTTHAGLSVSATSITDSGTTIILDKFICNNVDIMDRLEILAELIDWQFFYNSSDDKVYFQPKGTRAGTDTLTVGINVVNRPKWKRDGTKVVKKAVLFGGPIEVQTQETFSGDAVETEFTLLNIPISTKVVVDSVLKQGGIEGQSTGANYFVRTITLKGTENTEVGQIKFDTGSVPGSGTDNIVVDYSFGRPIVINDENPVTEGLEIRLDKPDLTTVEDARQYISKFMNRHQNDFQSTTLAVTNVTDLEVGQSVRTVDLNEGIDGNFIITRLRKQFPYAFDEVTVDNQILETEEWEISIEDRIRRIEERLLQEETLVIFNRSSSRTIKVGREWQKLQTRKIADGGGENSFILGHPSAGVLGTNQLGDRRQAAVLQKIQQGADIYVEDFLNVDFKAAATTATWTTTDSVTFTSGQNATSTEIDLDNGTITQVRLTAIEVTGQFLYEVTANGGTNWETTTSGTLHTFTNTGTDLRWRATENAVSTGEISEIKLAEYH